MYLAKAQINAIIPLNYLGLLVLYNVFLKKLKNIIIFNAIFMKKQAFINKLVSMWDNFKYKKNIAGKKIRDIVKFRSETMAL